MSMRIKMRVPDLEPEIRMQIEDERNAICTPVVVNKPIHYEIYHNEKEIHCDWEGLVAIATSPTAEVIQHDGYVEIVITDKNGTTRAVVYGGIVDYELLQNLPRINGIQVIGSKVCEDYDIQRTMDRLTNSDIASITG